MFEKLKKRWNIKSNFQVAVIFVVFAITGSSTIYVKRVFYEIIGITPETQLWIKVLLYLPVILIIYNVLLLFIGFMFGQFQFFLNFEKKFFARFLPRKRITSPVKNQN
jgi:hypothetical protein